MVPGLEVVGERPCVAHALEGGVHEARVTKVTEASRTRGDLHCT